MRPVSVSARQAAMSDVLAVQGAGQDPELNEYQCGTYSIHSLEEAHAIARQVLERGIGVNRTRRAGPAGREAEKPLSRDGKRKAGRLTGLPRVLVPSGGQGHHPVAPQLLGLL